MTVHFDSLYTRRDARNYYIYNGWLFGSMVAFAAATILIRGNFVPPAGGWTLTALSILLMLTTMRSYIVFLRYADELLRKVHLEALAFAFGIGMVVMMGYRLCERLGAPKLDVNDAALVMVLCWMAGQWLGARRYTVSAEEQ